jgi:hypothetical protein
MLKSYFCIFLMSAERFRIIAQNIFLQLALIFIIEQDGKKYVIYTHSIIINY